MFSALFAKTGFSRSRAPVRRRVCHTIGTVTALTDACNTGGHHVSRTRHGNFSHIEKRLRSRRPERRETRFEDFAQREKRMGQGAVGRRRQTGEIERYQVNMLVTFVP
jgi:hypothetical protein